MKMRLWKNITAMLLIAFILIVATGSASAAYDVKRVWVRFSATAGETLATGDLVCIKDADGYAYEADANDSDLRPALGIVGKGGASGASVEIIVIGVFSGWSGLSEGAEGYLSETASAVTQSAPSYAQQVGVAISTSEYFFNFSSYLDTSSITALGVLAGASPIQLEGATANDHETTIAVTDPTGDRTVTIPDSDVNLGAIANSLLAAGNAYFTVALSVNGQETSTVDPAATFQMPFAATLVEVSVCARDIDTTDTDETYTVDIEEAGTTVLGSAITIAADNTPVVGSVSDSAIADNAKIEAVVTLGGTSPAIDDLTILLTFKVAHSS